MIRSFRHRGLKKLFETGSARGVDPGMAKRLKRMLDVLKNATSPIDMAIPSYDLHELKGDRKGTWSAKVTGNWRLTFKFGSGDATDVDLEDYH